MRNKHPKRFWITLILTSILLQGFFKHSLTNFYSLGMMKSFMLICIDQSDLVGILIRFEFAKAFSWNDNKLGLLVYYPIYIGFHIGFIAVLFANNKKLRNILVLVLILSVILFKSLSIAGRMSGLDYLDDFSAKMVSRILNLPIILLLIEGGRILYRDVQRLIAIQGKSK